MRETHSIYPEGTIAIWLPLLRNRLSVAREYLDNIGLAVPSTPILTATLSVDADTHGTNTSIHTSYNANYLIVHCGCMGCYIDTSRHSRRGGGGRDGNSNGGGGMSGSTMVVINPPRDLEPELNVVMPWLHRTLAPHGYARVSPLVVSDDAHTRAQRAAELRATYEQSAAATAAANATSSGRPIPPRGAGTGAGQMRTGGYHYTAKSSSKVSTK